MTDSLTPAQFAKQTGLSLGYVYAQRWTEHPNWDEVLLRSPLSELVPPRVALCTNANRFQSSDSGASPIGGKALAPRCLRMIAVGLFEAHIHFVAVHSPVSCTDERDARGSGR